jgi:hypothetical protein
MLPRVCADQVLDPEEIVHPEGQRWNEAAAWDRDVEAKVVFEQGLSEDADGLAICKVHLDFALQGEGDNLSKVWQEEILYKFEMDSKQRG